jgi:hypothetical protein
MQNPDRVEVSPVLVNKTWQGARAHANPHNLQGFLDAFKASFGCIYYARGGSEIQFGFAASDLSEFLNQTAPESNIPSALRPRNSQRISRSDHELGGSVARDHPTHLRVHCPRECRRTKDGAARH